MGYMGFGMQRWITNMKPRPFFGRRERPGSEHVNDFKGHDTQNLYHLNHNKLETLNQKKPTTNYLKLLREQIKEENSRQRVYGLVIIIFSISVLVVTFVYLSQRFDLF